MRRRAGLTRRTPLTARTGLTRRSPLVARSGLRRSAPLRAVPKPWPVAVPVRLAVWRRSGGRCDACGRALREGWHAHHRRLRSQGGRHDPSNLLALDDQCHRSIHDQPGRSYADGLLVPGHADPARTPVLLHGTRLVLPAGDEWQAVAEPKGEAS